MDSFQPNILIVGFQKCGSSTLFSQLVKHSQIKGTTPKETYFLVDEDYENFNPTRNISNPKASWEFFIKGQATTPYILEGSVCNFYQKNAINYALCHPNTKVLFILRDPVERFISNYKSYSSRLLKYDVKSIEEYYEKVKAGAFSEDKYAFALKHGHYSKFINEWEKKLGKERVFILSMKKLVTDSTHDTLNEIFDFLSLDFENIGRLEKKNVSTTVRNKKIHQILLKYFGGKKIIPSFFKKIYTKLFVKEYSSFKVDNRLIKQLREEYQREYFLFEDYF